jgi:Ca-activated chloride channel family protein
MHLRKFLLPATCLTILCLFIFIACDKHLSSGSMFSQPNGVGDGPIEGVGNTAVIKENPFIKTVDSNTSTFSVDADGGSYAMTRRLLESNQFSYYKDALRTEEFTNYFTYDYADPTDNSPIAVNGEVSECPWNIDHKLIRIGIKGKSIQKQEYPLANFVLLIDVSGSMSSTDKLELLKSGFIDFVNQMRSQDRIAIVTYAGVESLALESTPGSQKSKIIVAIKKLGSGGSTNGAGGIRLAYEIAQKNFIQNGNNRVILGTDGDFNVGITTADDLVKLIEEKREQGVFLTSLGVGLGNYNEAMMEKVANNGNGNYEYLDSKEELKRVFIDEYNKFVTVAKDVKVQVTFNKDIVEEYRLIGYENRALKNDDFKNDKKDAGEIGAGQTITAIYEFKPKSGIDFKQKATFTINFRYKKPAENISQPIDLDIYDQGKTFEAASENMRFAASLASFGLWLRSSEYKGHTNIAAIRKWAEGAKNFDPYGYRAKHIELLSKVK